MWLMIGYSDLETLELVELDHLKAVTNADELIIEADGKSRLLDLVSQDFWDLGSSECNAPTFEFALSWFV